jgi:hypothetical protein
MNRPLIVTDCDEVLLHMVAHFRDYLGEEHGVDFRIEGGSFARAMRYRASGEVLPDQEMWRLLNLFFDSEMHRQTPIEGAVAAMARLAEEADVVVLTNLLDHRAETRAAQLAGHGIDARVFTNQGPKGPALKKIVDEFCPSRVAFIDDIAVHHRSASEVVPQAIRLHFCGEALMAPHIDCAHVAGDAHARIDRWDEALPWLLEKLHGENA